MQQDGTKTLKFKNGLYLEIAGASILTAWLIVFFAIVCLLAYIFDATTNYIIVLIVFSSVIAGLWIIIALIILFSGTVVVTDCEIKMVRFKKVKWCMQKADIEECRYNKFQWNTILLPIYIENEFLLQFKLNGKGVSKKNCSLSLKQVKRIQEELCYPLKIM
ncbi:MAG: hypothetical protein J1G38_05100 [Clostridiales bacterium]|nr:hypothetical protein [Clostridiales bacterium]